MEAKNMKRALSRREFLSATAGVVASGLILSSVPTIALADELVPMASAAGARINPYSVAMSGSRTLSNFPTHICFSS